MIAAIDDGVGGVLDALREKGIEEKTLIFFIGDNGAPLKIHKHDAPGGGPGWDGSLNDPLNGEKGMLTEGGIRVPFLAYWKGALPAGRVYDHPVISLDVAATALAAAGNAPEASTASTASAAALDGVNLLPHLTGRDASAPHETLYWRWIAQSAVREGRWKYLRGGAREYLYDVDADREEKRDLLAQHPDIAKRLRTRLEAWSRELQPPGLETKAMSGVWESYFDFYLDGKPAPPLRRRGRDARADKDPRVRGWIARNATAKLTKAGLSVRPRRKASHPFLAFGSLELPKKITAIVRMRSPKAGTAGCAWREPGQSTFPSDQAKTFPVEAGDKARPHELSIEAEGKIIHLRVLLPRAGADVEHIEIRSEDGKTLRQWSFVE